MSGVLRRLGLSKSPSIRSTQSSSSRASSDMQVDEPPKAMRGAASSSGEVLHILMEEKNLRWKNEEEKQRYRLIRKRTFYLTLVLDPTLLRDIGMDTEFDTIFEIIGWASFADITKDGCKLLTAEFLCTLQIMENGVEFRLFGKEQALTWR